VSSNDPRGEDPIHEQSNTERRAAFALELESQPAADLPSLVTYARHRRRLWMVAIPGFGLKLL
jgi:hypothetical protein